MSEQPHRVSPPDGWSLRVVERSAGVYEATVTDKFGRTASTSGTNESEAVTRAIEFAVDIQHRANVALTRPGGQAQTGGSADERQ